MIDLRSDTVTQPCQKMRSYMTQVPVGDDAYGEDESVNSLQDYCQKLFRVEAALFVASGMMANRIAFLVHTSPGDEVITEAAYHVNFFDSAPMSAFAGVVFNPRHTGDGILRVDDIKKAIVDKNRYNYFAQPKLVSLENTINCWGGKVFPYNDLREVYQFAKVEKIKVHLDGARLFNAHVATKTPLHDYTLCADTLSVCFSKALGAPFGSMLMGSYSTIQKAKKYRVWLGGAGHQLGIYAAAAHYALLHNIKSLEQDHRHAKFFAKLLKSIPGLSIREETVETNMVEFSVTLRHYNPDTFIEKCGLLGLKIYFWKPGLIRAVVHKHLTQQNLHQAAGIIAEVLRQLDH